MFPALPHFLNSFIRSAFQYKSHSLSHGTPTPTHLHSLSHSTPTPTHLHSLSHGTPTPTHLYSLSQRTPTPTHLHSQSSHTNSHSFTLSLIHFHSLKCNLTHSCIIFGAMVCSYALYLITEVPTAKIALANSVQTLALIGNGLTYSDQI